jgi:AraC-like DNA-binding protein
MGRNITATDVSPHPTKPDVRRVPDLASLWYDLGVAGFRQANDSTRDGRLEQVRQGICETIAPYDLRVDADQDCRAEVHAVDLGMVRIVCGSGQIDGEVFRSPRLIRRSDPELCKIDLQVRGRAVVEQDDRQAALGPNAFAFVDLSRPSHLAGGLGGVAAVTFPRSLLPLRHRDTRPLSGVRFAPQDPNSALVAALVGQVARRPQAYASPAGGRVGAALLDLITVALATRLDRTDTLPLDTRAHALTWRIKTFIEDHLSDPGLTPGQVAAAHHLSVRYLHRIFAAQETTVGSWIRDRRLDHCRRDLTDPALVQRSVSAVGARWGFVDATHFGRVFKTAYGVTPAEYRRRHG